MKRRRKRLYVRQSLAYREGKSHDASWGVGYWDNKPQAHADTAFRCFGNRPTEAEAVEFAKEIAAKQKTEYIFGE